MTLAKHKVVLSIVAAMMFSLALTPALYTQTTSSNDIVDVTGDTFGLKQFNKDPGQGGLALGKKGLQETIAQLINVALSLLGVIAVVIVLIGGFKWMTAGGNDDKVAEGRKYIVSGVIGLAIILSAWAVTTFVFKALQNATGSGALPENL